jgi:phage shock protein PspC (stress-responsive transcriptional regulator)
MDQNSNGRGPAGGFDPGRMRDLQNWRRSRSDRLIAGVCGGIARALDIDPVLVRVVVAVLIIAGPGLPLYIAAWVLMPEEGADRSPAQELLGDRVRPDLPWLWPAIICCTVFIAIAIASSVNSGPFKFGPLLAVLAIWYVFFHKKDRGRPPSYPGPDAPTGPVTPATDRPQDRPADSPVGGSVRPQDSPGTSPVQPVWTEDDPLGLYVDEGHPARGTTSAVPAAPGRRGVKPIVFAATVVAIGIALLAGASASLALAIGMATLGSGMLVGGFIGRTLGLLPVGILLAIGVVATQLFPTIPTMREVNFVATPQNKITEIVTAHTFDAGSIKLDLTNATFDSDTKVTVNGRAGEVVITLPKNVDVTGSAAVKLGEVKALDRSSEGYNALQDFSDPAPVPDPDLGADGKAGPASVELDLDLIVGSIRVERE